jgi:leader peptidase (prepilin peptidase)/N-methyltransferase
VDDLRLLLLPPSMQPPAVALLSLVWAFVVGAAWGSFTNVVIARVPAGLSVVTPRSRCPRCKTQIRAFDNIPVASWFVLRGACRSCRAPISFRYPFIEALMGLAAMAVVARFGISLAALELFVFIAILVAIAFVDIDTWTVPNPLWISLVVAGFAFGVGEALLTSTPPAWQGLIDRVLGAVGAGLFLGSLIVVATGILRRTGRLVGDQGAMGWGDPLILVGIGAFLGWRLLPLVIFLGSLQGSVVAAALMGRGKLKGDAPVSDTDAWVPPKHAVPFGPFLALGALQAAFFGDAILARWAWLIGVSQ